MDRFMLAQNPMSGNGHVAILHTINPVAIIQVVDGELVVRYCEDPESEEKLLKKAWHWYKSYLEYEQSKNN